MLQQGDGDRMGQGDDDAVGNNYCVITDVGSNEGGGEYSVGRRLVLDGFDELSMFFFSIITAGSYN